MKYSKTKALSFPLIFGGLLSIVGVGFYKREYWMGDIESSKAEIYKTNENTDHILEDLKKNRGKKLELLK